MQEIIQSITENKKKLDTSKRGESVRGRREQKKVPIIRSTVVNKPLHNDENCQCLMLQEENSADNTALLGKEHCC
jgi:hypothetical protein